MDKVTTKSAVSVRPPLPEPLRRERGADLYRAIFQSESPEASVRALSPQAVYLALTGYGVESGIDLLRMVPDHYYRIFLDFHFWDRDEFSEEAFWRWLEAIDQDDSLSPLQQFIRTADQRVLARIIALHVHAIIGEEKAEAPPGDGYYTPDQGYTWVAIQLENPRQHRLLARLLAMIFQLSPELFYQTINIASGSTGIELLESAFVEKSRRLSDEGLPDPETNARLHSPLDLGSVKAMLGARERQSVRINPVFAPIVHLPGRLEPLSTVFDELSKDEEARTELESELSLIANAAILRYLGSLADSESVEKQIQQVRGTLNIGLERAVTTFSISAEELVREIGLQPFYRLGLFELRALRRRVREFLETPPVADASPELRLVAEGILSGDLPTRPAGLSVDGSLTISPDETPRFEFIQSLSEVGAVDALIRRSSH